MAKIAVVVARLVPESKAYREKTIQEVESEIKKASVTMPYLAEIKDVTVLDV